VLKPPIKHGRDWGLHRGLTWPVAKLVYALIFTLLWLIFGSFLFGFLEDGGMERYSSGTHDIESIIATMQRVTKLPELSEVERKHLINAATFMENNKPARITWGPEGGFFFSLLSLTTIGYGRYLIPRSVAGRLLVIPYTLIGMPVLGILYTVWAKVSLRAVRRLVGYCQGHRASKLQTTVIATGLLWLFLFVGAPGLFMATEEWEYYEAVYFVYVTVSTIGYGDFVPTTAMGMLILLLIAPIGLGLVALALAALGQWFEDLFKFFDYNEDTWDDMKKKYQAQALSGDSDLPYYDSIEDSNGGTPIHSICETSETEDRVTAPLLGPHSSHTEQAHTAPLLGPHSSQRFQEEPGLQKKTELGEASSQGESAARNLEAPVGVDDSDLEKNSD